MLRDRPGQNSTAITSQPIVMTTENIDTDQIIPARFLTTTTREGLGANLFQDWRYDGETPKPDFVLNDAEMAQRTILVAGHNFGCGSSREHAPWALSDFGFRAVLSTEIADIFRSNAAKNGLVPVQISQSLYEYIRSHPDAEITIDLDALEVRIAGGPTERFEIEPFARHCLMNGVDQLGYLMAQSGRIAAYEEARP